MTALFLANLPFVSNRVFGVFQRPHKGLGLRFLELLLGYFITLALGIFIESTIGSIYSQGWQFYAVMACLFLVFAYPGFVYRYLWRKNQG